MLELKHKTLLNRESEVTLLTNLFSSACNDWPRSDICDQAIRNNAYANLIIAWSASMYSEVKKLQQFELMTNLDYEDLGSAQLEFAFGRLCNIEQIPSVLDPLVIERKEWTLRRKIFSRENGEELSKLFRESGLDLIYAFYKTVMAHADNPPPYITKLELIKASIRKNHLNKKCEWFRLSAGWSFYWMKLIDFYGHFNGGQCPYNYLLSELEASWGASESLMSSRKREQHKFWFLWLSKELHKYQFVRYKSEFALSKEGLLYFSFEILSSCEWQNRALSKSFNIFASFELDIAFRRGLSWIRSIGKYDNPLKIPESYGSIRLTIIDDQLTVLKWQNL